MTEEPTSLDVRNIEDSLRRRTQRHGCRWWMSTPRAERATDGGFLELVNEFRGGGRGLRLPHSHPTHEFYYVLRAGVMTIAGEDRDNRPGRPGVHPPDAVHSLRPSRNTPRSTASASPSGQGFRPRRLHHPLTSGLRGPGRSERPGWSAQPLAPPPPAKRPGGGAPPWSTPALSARSTPFSPASRADRRR